MKKLLLAVAAAGALAAGANETWTIDVAEGVTETISDALGAGTNIVKTGKGKLVIVENAGSTAFSGTVTVEAGTLEAQSSTSVASRSLSSAIPIFGGNKPENTLIVKNGATLLCRFAAPGGNDQARPVLANNLVIEGTGVDGKGALIAGGSGNIDHYFAGSVSLSGDARAAQTGSGLRWGFNGTGDQTVSLNGHTLTVGSSSFVFDGMKYDAGEGGRIAITNKTEVFFLYSGPGTSRFVGNGTLSFAHDCNLKCWGGKEAPNEIPVSLPWKVEFASDASDSSSAIYVGKGWVTVDGDVMFGDAATSNTTVTTYGNKTGLRATFKGGLTGLGQLTKAGAELEMLVTGKVARTLGTLYLKSGKFTLHDAGLMTVTRTVQNTISGHLIAKGDSGIAFGPEGFAEWKATPPTLYVNGTVEVDGGSVTGKVIGANTATEHAVYLIRNGDLSVWGGEANDAYLTKFGTAYIGQTGGRLCLRSCTSLIARYADGKAVYEMKGGEFTAPPALGGNVALLRGGTNSVAVMYQTGGTVNWQTTTGYRDFMFATGSYGNAYRNGGRVVVTLDGTEASFKAASVNMCNQKDDAVMTLNLNAGTVEATVIEQKFGSGAHANTRTYLNFNGGTYRLRANSDNIFGSSTATTEPLSRVTVFEDGATIDTAGFNATVAAVPLSAPEGRGIETVAFPSGAVLTGYAVAPVVTIDGDGEDATVFCAFNADTGTIGPLTVTSPGRNYTTATATIPSADGKSTVTLDLTLASPASGGLAKKGAGTLTLACANGYAGKTVVEGGTLNLAAAGACPADAVLEIPAASLASRTDATPVVATSVGCPFGEIRITGADALDPKTFGSTCTLVDSTAALAAVPNVRLCDSTGAEVTRREFRVSVAKGGRALRFGVARGLVITVE